MTIDELVGKTFSINDELATNTTQDATTDVVKPRQIYRLDEYQSQLGREIQQLKDVIESYFPQRSFAILVCLAVKVQLMIEGITQVFPLILMGRPSSHKSTILEIISSLPNCIVSDSFTPKSFVSHSASISKKNLKKIDLLPRIRHKTLITPELAPLFSGNPDQLIEYFGMLTRILDGRGFQSNSGVHGQRGYQGDYSFTWLGAVVDIPHRVWKLLGNLGPKIYFFRLPDDPKIGNEKIQQIKKNLKESSYTMKLKDSKKVVNEFWKLLEKRPGRVKEKIIWDTVNDDEDTFNKIIILAMVLSNLRATVPTWQTGSSGGASYNYETPVIEDPQRASSALYNLARGHAVLYGRNYITLTDLRVVIPVALSSAPRERVDLFKLLIENNGKLNTDQFISQAQVSRATARKEMEILVKIGLVDGFEEEADTKPVLAVKLKDEFNWFLSGEFRSYWDEYKDSLTCKNSKLSFQKNRDNLEKNGMSGGEECSTPESTTLDTFVGEQN